MSDEVESAFGKLDKDVVDSVVVLLRDVDRQGYSYPLFIGLIGFDGARKAFAMEKPRGAVRQIDGSKNKLLHPVEVFIKAHDGRMQGIRVCVREAEGKKKGDGQ